MLKRMIFANYKRNQKKTLRLKTAKLTMMKYLLSITLIGIKSCDFDFCEYYCETHKTVNTKNISMECYSVVRK